MTGYLTVNGIDLFNIFQPGNSGIKTGYLLSNGDDIGSIFLQRNQNSADPTGLKIISGEDISTLFEGIVIIPFTIPGCCLWLDSNDSSTITTISNKVSEWRDKSPSQFLFQQTIPSCRPTYTLNGQNGLPTITFDATFNTYLQGTPNFAIGTNSYALFAVCNITNDAISVGIFNKSYFGSEAGRIIMTRTANLNIAYQHAPGTQSQLAQTSKAYVIGRYRMLELIVNRTPDNKDYSYQNGVLLTSSPAAIVDTTNYTPSQHLMLVGSYNDVAGGQRPDFALTGNVCEIISYSSSSNMSDAGRQKIEGYLAWKWGIQTLLPSNHPYFNSSP